MLEEHDRCADTPIMDTSMLTLRDKVAIVDTTLRIAVAMFLALVGFSELLIVVST